MRRGDVYYADLRPVIGSEQGGIRPVLIVQNDVGNKHSPTVICAAITSKMNKAKLPTHIEVKGIVRGAGRWVRCDFFFGRTSEQHQHRNWAGPTHGHDPA